MGVLCTGWPVYRAVLIGLFTALYLAGCPLYWLACLLRCADWPVYRPALIGLSTALYRYECYFISTQQPSSKCIIPVDGIRLDRLSRIHKAPDSSTRSPTTLCQKVDLMNREDETCL